MTVRMLKARQPPTFKNSYTTTEATLDLSATKTLEGKKLTANQFNFKLEKVSAVDTQNNTIEDSNAEQSNLTNDASGNIAINSLKFQRAGTTVYKITETSEGGNGHYNRLEHVSGNRDGNG